MSINIFIFLFFYFIISFLRKCTSACDNFLVISLGLCSEREAEGGDRFLCHCPIATVSWLGPCRGEFVGDRGGGGGLAKCLDIFFCLVSVWLIGGRGWQ